jgi:hypothetical protein
VSLGSASVANLNDKNKYKLLVGQIKWIEG